MPLIKVPKEERHLIEPYMVAQMMEKAQTLKDKSIIALYFITGMRVKEAFKIRKEDIWQDEKYVYVRIEYQKRSKKEVIPLTSVLPINKETNFLSYIIQQWASINDGEYIWNYASNPDTARVYVWKMLKDLNPNIWIHLFRHTRNDYFRRKGMTREQRMAWFGWTDIRTPDKYTHVSDKELKEMGDVIE